MSCPDVHRFLSIQAESDLEAPISSCTLGSRTSVNLSTLPTSEKCYSKRSPENTLKLCRQHTLRKLLGRLVG